VSGGREGWRRAAVRSCEIFFLLILLEGVLRKWLMNPIQQPLTLIRDPLLLVIYVQYCGYRGWRLPLWFAAVASMFAIFLIVILIQSSYLNFEFDVYLIGIRNYIVYVPLSFVMYEIYDRNEVNKLLRLFLYTTVPVAVLVVMQFYSPLGSPLNRAMDGSIDGIFQVADGVVRPYGPFTFTYGQAVYSAMALAVGLIALDRRKEMSLPTPLLIVFLASIGSMGVVSGSRTYFLSAGGILICYMLSALTSTRKASIVKQGLYTLVVLTGLLILMTVVFPRALETMSERQADAVAGEGSTLDRAVFIATEMGSVVGDTPFFGRGIGFGSNAGAYAATGEVQFTLAEYEWTRITLECGPLLGVIVISIRVLLTIWAGALALRANRRFGDAAPLAMFGLVFPLIFYEPISNNNTLMSIGWFSLGLLLALCATSAGVRNRGMASRATFSAHTAGEPRVA
jgi:hypothetical protein